ncbi:MAG: hypothetical protein M5U28_52650 [Sandaracinaceae bacterium]|nr:hypothetical protein [Sandaracinaceae bacterium]
MHTDLAVAPAPIRIGARGRIRATPVLQHLPRLADRVLLQSLYLRGYSSRRLRTSVGSMHALECEGAGRCRPS